MAIIASVVELPPERDGRVYRTYTLRDDQNINPEINTVKIVKVLEDPKVDPSVKAQEHINNFLITAAQQEHDIAIRDLANGIDISARTYAYTTKQTVLTTIYNETAPGQAKLSDNIGAVNNTLNKIKLLFGLV